MVMHLLNHCCNGNTTVSSVQ